MVQKPHTGGTKNNTKSTNYANATHTIKQGHPNGLGSGALVLRLKVSAQWFWILSNYKQYGHECLSLPARYRRFVMGW